MKRFNFTRYSNGAWALHWNIIKPSAYAYNLAAAIYFHKFFMTGSFVLVREEHHSILSWVFTPKWGKLFSWVFRRESIS